MTKDSGATLLDDLSGLKLPWIKTQNQLNTLEAENVHEAVKKHLKKWTRFSEVLSPVLLQKIHFDMFGTVWDWAGKWRTKITNIGAEPFQIPILVKELCADVKFWHEQPEDASTTLEQAAILHHRLVKIHPFNNGNGRFGRLLSDIYLLSYYGTIPKWPRNLHQTQSQYRPKYLKALRDADLGNYQPLLSLLKELGIQ